MTPYRKTTDKYSPIFSADQVPKSSRSIYVVMGTQGDGTDNISNWAIASYWDEGKAEDHLRAVRHRHNELRPVAVRLCAQWADQGCQPAAGGLEQDPANTWDPHTNEYMPDHPFDMYDFEWEDRFYIQPVPVPD